MKPKDSSRTVLIDTDTASDDAVALIMALRSPLVTVAAITVVAGNVSVEQSTSNALYTAELCDSGVPIYTGATKPLVRELQMADWFHGVDGLGGHGYVPAARRAALGAGQIDGGQTDLAARLPADVRRAPRAPEDL